MMTLECIILNVVAFVERLFEIRRIVWFLNHFVFLNQLTDINAKDKDEGRSNPNLTRKETNNRATIATTIATTNQNRDLNNRNKFFIFFSILLV